MNPTTRFITLSMAVLVACGLTTGAAAFSPPPSWSPMAMMDITYSSTTHTINMVDESVKMGIGVYAVLAIDTYNDPSVSSTYAKPNNAATAFGSFDPAQPWSVLNNTAFCRRLGWNPGTGIQANIQAAYGAGASIWIQCRSKSPGLESYLAVGKYGVASAGLLDSSSVPIVDGLAHGYSGIFGTAGSPDIWQWDYMMDHNVYAVPAEYITMANQIFTAEYKVYVGDSAGNEILNPDQSSPATIETWTWQGPSNVPEPVTLTLLSAGAALLMARRRKR